MSHLIQFCRYTDFKMMSHTRLQCVLAFMLCQILCTAHCTGPATPEQLPTQRTPCVYPLGTIPCKIWNYTNLDCRARRMECIPSMPHDGSIKALDISLNRISFIPDYAFSTLRELHHLDVSRNRISTLDDAAFSGLRKLYFLDLSHNSIQFVNARAFTKLHQLHTLDLSTNYLSVLHDNSFSGLSLLQNLTLSYNNISIINNNAFLGLNNLKYLDISANVAKRRMHLGQSLFHSLTSLQTLKIHPQYIDFSNTTLLELGSLEELTIDFDSTERIPDGPFQGLHSLHRLDVFVTPDNAISYCEKLDKSITGMKDLEYLRLTQIGVSTCCNVTLCSLVSLKALYMKGGCVSIKADECLKTIPLEFLLFKPQYVEAIHPPYRMLTYLKNLSLDILTDSAADLTVLETVITPLRQLTLYFTDMTSLNATTFESGSKWHESLHVLELSWTHLDFTIDSSPFQRFSNLHILRVYGRIRALSYDTFLGLTNLQELYMLMVHTNVFASGALQTFSIYNTLRIIEFPLSQMSSHITGDQLCSISSSLETINLSDNSLVGFTQDLPCALKNLQNLIIKKQGKIYTPPWSVEAICDGAPNLNRLEAKTAGAITFKNCTASDNCSCLNLQLIDLSENHVVYNNDDTSLLTPRLEQLYLSSLDLPSLEMIRIFQSYRLKLLDLSNNQIGEISEQDTVYLQNLIWFNLNNNLLTSIRSLQYLKNIQTIYLSENKIGVIPKSFLSKTKYSFIQSINLNQNPIICDCKVEALRRWLLTDNVAYLEGYFKSDKNYCCALPDSAKGLSVTEVPLDCESRMWLYITVSVSCATVLILLSIFAVRYRWHIQYRLFLLFNRTRDHQDRYLINNDNVDENMNDDDEDGLPRYDAYVTYHREDEDWVDAELVANIEEGDEPFRLCLRTRDIRAGRLIFNELSLRIQRSRKILVILSPRFVNDNWCYFELNMAHQRVLEENRNVMIFIILEEIPNKKLTLLLRQLFCRVQVIKWPPDGYGQYLFWRRLREELKRPVPLDRRFNL